MKKIQEELGELQSAIDAGDRDATREEIGDLLFATAMLARKLNQDPEGALEGANRKFTSRFKTIEVRAAASGQAIESLGIERLEELWAEAKARED